MIQLKIDNATGNGDGTAAVRIWNDESKDEISRTIHLQNPDEIDELVSETESRFGSAAAGHTSTMIAAYGAEEITTDPKYVASAGENSAVNAAIADVAKQLTDCGNAARFVIQHSQSVRFCHQRGSWLWWDGTRWRWDESGKAVGLAKRTALSIFDEAQAESRAAAKATDEQQQARHAAKASALAKWALASQKRERIAAMLELAKPDLTVAVADLDSDQFLLAVENGTIDLRAGELHPHRQSDLITRVSPVRFDRAAVCATWMNFLNRIMAGNSRLVDYLQRLAGLCASGSNIVQELFIGHGIGANGKSVFVDTLSYILGDHAGIAPESLLIHRNTGNEHPTEIAGLAGKRCIIASETEGSGKLRLQLVKKMTGDDKLTGRFMRCDYFTFDRTFKLILVTNNKPRIGESTEAAWRRIRLIPFNVVIPESERDPDLLAKLKAEASGILNWIIAGCLAWQKNGMQPPPEVLAATSDYKAEADPLADFWDSCCIVGEFARVSRAEVWAEYQSWMKRTGERDGLDRTALYERLRRRSDVREDVWKASGKAIRGFTGIGLCAAAAGPDLSPD